MKDYYTQHRIIEFTTHRISNRLSTHKCNETQHRKPNMTQHEETDTTQHRISIRLNTEKDILNITYQECLIALSSLSHEKVISSLLKSIKEELPEAAYIYSNKRDAPLVRSLSTFSYGGSIECLGGIVVENKDKTMKIDYRYEMIAETVWDRSLKEIAEKLFR